MIPFCTSGTTISPVASKTKIVGRFPTDMVGAEMVIESIGVLVGPVTVVPLARKRVYIRLIIR